MFLPKQGIMVIADLHLGKAMHFRKAGLFVPPGSAQKDYQVLQHLMQQYKPLEVWFLGDLFHSDYNTEWLQFKAFIQTYTSTRFTLVRGNHDILEAAYYEQLHIRMVPQAVQLENLVFSHEPLASVANEAINIAGHIHPGCLLRGLGRQSMRIPCFYRYNHTFLLPAFGALTGLRMMEQAKDATVFAIAPDRVFLL